MGACLTKQSSVRESPPLQPSPSPPELELHAVDVSTTDDGRPVYVCTHDYESRTDDDLGLKKGDLLHVLDTDDDGWWLARSITSGKSGYIPSNYVAERNSLEAEDWFFGRLNRSEAEKHLMLDGNSAGSFLVRDSEATPGEFTLSIRDQDKVKHYPIQYQFSNGGIFYVTEEASFSSISDLVAHHRQHSVGSCRILTLPCIVSERPRTNGLSKQANKEWDISMCQLKLVKRLGTGQFAEVWEALWNGKMPVAAKTLKPGLIPASDLLLEAAIIKSFTHPNLVQLYAVSTKQEPIFVVVELMKNGNLLEYLRLSGRSLKEPQLIDMAKQVASGMAYLEEKNYVHRDLAAKSVLVGEHLICKVSDFGLTRLIDEDTYSSHIGTKFPIKWTAPEAAMYNRFTVKSDIWSFGIVLYEIITHGRNPYAGLTGRQILEEVSCGRYRMPCPKDCPVKLHNMMLKCWSQEPTNRPSFSTLEQELREFYSSTIQ